MLEEWDTSTWRLNPAAPGAERLIELIGEAFAQAGGDPYAGRKLPELLRTVGIDGNVRAEVVALPSGHPYLQVPLQFATALEQRLLSLVTADELEQLRKDATAELQEPGRWGTTFMLLQSWGRRAT